ncbi:hypothetical protein [Actinomycetospora chiangmaiensis]|nr:hypothetical protein [Actinomycetospora chiangmaiensis]
MIESWMLFVLVGIVIGYFLGRWRAETGRARRDGRNAWNGRKNYRS